MHECMREHQQPLEWEASEHFHSSRTLLPPPQAVGSLSALIPALLVKQRLQSQALGTLKLRHLVDFGELKMERRCRGSSSNAVFENPSVI